MFPNTYIAVVTADGVRGDQPWSRVVNGLAALEQRSAEGDWVPPDESDPRIAVWHETYRLFGTNPQRRLPRLIQPCAPGQHHLVVFRVHPRDRGFEFPSQII